jgi:hypothetical protein
LPFPGKSITNNFFADEISNKYKCIHCYLTFIEENTLRTHIEEAHLDINLVFCLFAFFIEEISQIFLNFTQQSLNKVLFLTVHSPIHQIQLCSRATVFNLNFLDTSLKSVLESPSYKYTWPRGKEKKLSQYF